MTTEQKQEIVSLIKAEIKALGSQTRVAKKLKISDATLSANILNPDNWSKIKESTWSDFATILDFQFNEQKWQIVDTFNTRKVHACLKTAQEQRMCLMISEKAGSGKTASIRAYKARNKGDVFVMECKEWSKKVFLTKLGQTVGVTFSTKSKAYEMAEEITAFFKAKAISSQPVLILDEADKLTPSALRYVISFFNDLEDECGMVLAGTEYLEKMLKAGVKRQSMGFDEIESRFGRAYIHLAGADKNDVVAIATANGITDEKQIDEIWEQVEKTYATGKQVTQDLRRLKRVILKTKLKYGN